MTELYPIAQKNGFSFVGWLDEEGNELSATSLAWDKTYYANYIDDIAPEINLTASKNVADSQTIEIDAIDNGSGVKGYYFGADNPLYQEVTFSDANTGIVSDAGTYYYAAMDHDGNIACDEITFYSVTLHLNGGTLANDRILLSEGTEITLPEPNKSGYSGVWQDIETGEIIVNAIADGEKVYTVLWTPNRYLVSFNANGGSCDATPVEVIFDSGYGELPTPAARYGYGFKGWYTSQTGGTLVLSDTIMSTAKNHTLYAQWNYTHVHSSGCYRVSTCTQSIVCREYDVFEDGAISYTHVCPNCGGVGGGRCGGGHSGQACGQTISVKICGLP